MRELPELFWNANISEMQQGYLFDNITQEYICLICGNCFSKGIIYQLNNTLYEAEIAIQMHLTGNHSVFDYLLNINKKMTGLSEHQKTLLKYFYNDYSDNEIAAKLGSSASTVRNYRYMFKQKEKQAKIFLALMDLLEKRFILKNYK